MRVALITSWPPVLCGVAEYNQNLVKHAPADVEYKIIQGASWGTPFTDQQILNESQDCDVVHMSWERGLMSGITHDAFNHLRGQRKKLVVSYLNVWPGSYDRDHLMLSRFDKILSHDAQEAEKQGWIYIPHGIIETETVPDDQVQMKLGMAGFPKHNKGAHIMAEIAKTLGLGVLLFAPHSMHADAGGTSAHIYSILPEAEIINEFMPGEHIVHRLSECVVNCGLWTTHSEESGVSGSVRFSIGAKRPTVVSRAPMYRDLFPYGDEIYFVDSDQPTFENVLPVVKQAVEEQKKRPNRIMKDMNWTTVAEKHAEVYRSLLT